MSGPMLDRLNDWLDRQPVLDDITYRGVAIDDMPADTARRLLAFYIGRELEAMRRDTRLWADATPKAKEHMVWAKLEGADL